MGCNTIIGGSRKSCQMVSRLPGIRKTLRSFIFLNTCDEYGSEVLLLIGPGNTKPEDLEQSKKRNDHLQF